MKTANQRRPSSLTTCPACGDNVIVRPLLDNTTMLFNPAPTRFGAYVFTDACRIALPIGNVRIVSDQSDLRYSRHRCTGKDLIA